MISNTYEEIKQVLNEAINSFKLKVELIRISNKEIEQEVSRTFEISGKHTLYNLHQAIQRGFDWDNDHMFSFYLSGKLGDRSTEYSANPLGHHIESNIGQSSKSAGEAQLRDLKLSIGLSFWYLFDYGEEIVHKSNHRRN